MSARFLKAALLVICGLFAGCDKSPKVTQVVLSPQEVRAIQAGCADLGYASSVNMNHAGEPTSVSCFKLFTLNDPKLEKKSEK